MNIAQQVLNAFQVEHKEQLERIRALLSDLERAAPSARRDSLDEAFRMAHSLKGGARVCDLRPAETLGHGLETVFSQLREGTLELDSPVVETVHLVLDAIEDWMAALADNDAPPAPDDALRAIERVIEGRTRDRVERGGDLDDDTRHALLSAFRSEYRGYADRLRAFLLARRDGSAASPQEIDDAFRIADDLTASARAAGLAAVERHGTSLVELCRRLRNGAIEFDDGARQCLESALASIDLQVAQAAAERVAGGDDQRPAPPTGGKADASAGPLETVRISAQSLDRILQSSNQLLNENIREQQLGREIGELREQIEHLERQRESFRRAAGRGQHRWVDAPELGDLRRYLEASDRQIRAVAQCVRRIHLAHQRSRWQLQSCGNRIQRDVRQARMVSVAGLYQAFPTMVRSLARDEGKQVDFKLQGAEVRADRVVLQALKDPIMHMLRNAVIHGIEPPEERRRRGKPEAGKVALMLATVGNRLQVVIEDDGRGVDWHRVAERAGYTAPDGASSGGEATAQLARAIFQPGFSTCSTVTELAGRGMGLSVVQETVKNLQGEVQLRLDRPLGTSIALAVPLSVCTHRLLLIESGRATYAIPLAAIERLARVGRHEIESLEGVPVVIHGRQPIRIASLDVLLGGAPAPAAHDALSTVILKSAAGRVALAVDQFLGERDALVQELDRFSAHENYAGAALLEDGRSVLVLNAARLVECRAPAHQTPADASPAPAAVSHAPRILVVDDSFTTRTLEKSILEAHGFQVHVATDGVEALAALQSSDIDAVITDIEMPRLDGFGLLEEMKRRPRLAGVPCILVTSRDRAADQQRGLELGADAYIVKRKFDHQELLATIQQVL